MLYKIRWRRASALKNRRRSRDESGASRSARYYSGSAASSIVSSRSTNHDHLGEIGERRRCDGRTLAAAGHRTWSETKMSASRYSR
jgi:hypothetical protein